MLHEIKKIPLQGANNTRDLGEFYAADGRKIRSRRLLRSGDLHGITASDKELLAKEYHLKTVIDFRTEAERMEKPDQELDGVINIHNPIVEESTLGITREKNAEKGLAGMVLSQLNSVEGTETEYMEMLYKNLAANKYSRKQYREFFQIILNNKEGAVLWHCTAGKDRAGMGTAFLLSALGVSREQIIADYMMTNIFTAETTDAVIKTITEKTGDGRVAERIRVLFGVQESYIESVFSFIEEEYGTIENYLSKVMRMDEGSIETLRNKYLY